MLLFTESSVEKLWNMKIRFRKKSTGKLNKTFFSPGKGRSDNKVIYIHQNKINEVILLSVFSSAVCRCNKSSWLAEQGGILETWVFLFIFEAVHIAAHEQTPFPDSFSAIPFMLSSSFKNILIIPFLICPFAQQFLNFSLIGSVEHSDIGPSPSDHC